MYPESQIHAKVYVMRKDLTKVPDQFGSVITGSSNFSMAGLKNNLEFNVELKDSRDVQFALDKFNELWEQSIPISDEYIETVHERTWLRDDITPYELYLKTIYEYFKEEINQDKDERWMELLPDGYMQLQYQSDAVVQARKTLDAYGGVFISDVVGLGKTFICAMLGQQLKGKKLFICPPILVDYWEKVLRDFEVAGTKVESLGKLDLLLQEGVDEYKYVFIDEAHRFRNQATESFQKLHQICFNKKVVLITATPQNNFSSDIANQIYLFQPKHNSVTIPNQKNLEGFFRKLEVPLKKLDKNSPEYKQRLRENSEIIRDQVLRNIMIRRTRKEIIEFYGEDLSRQGLRFPELGSPEKIVYSFDNQVEEVFNNTIRTIRTLDYARYAPLTYLKSIDKKVASLIVSQKNMSGFMKSILVKRLESSFFAFKKTLGRFITSYENFIRMCQGGEVYISKQVDIYDLLDHGDDERLMELVENEKAQYFSIDDFRETFIPSLQRDLTMLKELHQDWERIDSDPKLDQFMTEIKNNSILGNNKMIIFTESKETAQYIGDRLNKAYPERVIVFSGESKEKIRFEIASNFNPMAKEKKDEIQFLVTTDVLAEGINLHRSNIILNYDLPWNPTRVMQRVGRVNRVGTKHERIYVFNFFPTAQTSAHLPLEVNIIQKIQAFHDTLGEDFKYLSDSEEVTSHKLYHTLNSSDSLESEGGSGNSELTYLKLIRKIRDEDVDLFERIKKLPLKARSGRTIESIESDQTLTFMRKGYLRKFFLSDGNISKEIVFLEAMNYLGAKPMEHRIKLPGKFVDQLILNKATFQEALNTDNQLMTEKVTKSGNDARMIKLLKALSRCRTFTDDQEEMIKKFINAWEEGDIPASITKSILKETKTVEDEIQAYYIVLNTVPEQYLEKRVLRKSNDVGEKQVILSLFIQKGECV